MSARGRRGRGGYAGRAVFRLGIFLLAGVVVWTLGLFWFAASLPVRVADEERCGAVSLSGGASDGSAAVAPPGECRTDAIVVLTGGSGRLGAGLALLDADRAEKLFVSGVYRGVDVRRLLALFQRSPDGLETRLGIGNATDTIGNAAETAKWIAGQGFSSLRLVTAAYHMPRALLEFRREMPNVKLVPHPVFPKHVKQDRWWAWPGTTNLIAGEYNKYLLARLRHVYLALAESLSGGAA